FCAGEEARIFAVRAKPTTGGKLGSAQTTGCLVKPSAVRPPMTCSSALHTVGVSALRRAASASGDIFAIKNSSSRLAGDLGAVAQRLQLCPDDIRVHGPETGKGRKSTVGAGDDPFGADDVDEILEPLRDQLGMLD